MERDKETGGGRRRNKVTLLVRRGLDERNASDNELQPLLISQCINTQRLTQAYAHIQNPQTYTCQLHPWHLRVY